MKKTILRLILDWLKRRSYKVLPCTECGRSTPTAEAHMSILDRDISGCVQAHGTFEAEHPPGAATRLIDVPDLDLRWRWGHYACMPEGAAYWVSGDDLDTPEKALARTLHLKGKRWFNWTDWDAFMRRFGYVA